MSETQAPYTMPMNPALTLRRDVRSGDMIHAGDYLTSVRGKDGTLWYHRSKAGEVVHAVALTDAVDGGWVAIPVDPTYAIEGDRPMTETATPIDTRTWIMRTTGASAEDAERVMTRVADEAIAWYIASHSLPEPDPEPQPERKPIEIHVHLTLDGDAERVAERVMQAIGEIGGEA